jgi:hypothetical protein
VGDAEVPEAESPDARWHATAAEELFGTPIEDVRAEREEGASRWYVSSGTYEAEGATYEYRLRTARGGRELLQHAVWYARAAGADAAGQAGAASAALVVDGDDVGEIVRRPGVYLDRRLGFGFQDVTSGLVFEDATPSHLRGSLRIAVASVRGGSLTLFSIAGVDSHGAQTIVEMMVERLGSSESARLWRRRADSSGEIDGVPCSVSTWTAPFRRRVMWTVTRGGAVHVAVVEGDGRSLDEERWRRALRFVPL